MFASQTVQVSSQSTPVELTAGIDTADRFVLVLRVPDGFTQPVRIGTSTVSAGSGFSISGGEQITMTLEDAQVFAVSQSSSSTVPIDVLAYSA